MPRRAAPILLLALALAGCGQATAGDTGDFSGEEGAVAEVVGELANSAARGEAAVVCDDLLAEELQRAVAGEDEDCISEVGKAFDDADALAIDVDDVTVTGTEATAQVSTEVDGEPVERTFTFAKVDGEWRITSFG